jgi:organic hydroperoxide reductase OsmC/OhrA
MSRQINVGFTAIGGTQAGLGHAGGHSLVADRPVGLAGGTGLGFNGGELLAAALGGCFWNDLHYAAETFGAAIKVQAVNVDITLDGAPPRVTAARIVARLVADSPDAARQIFAAASAGSTIANSIRPAIPVTFDLEEQLP